jgi:copper chaperone NosL
MTKAQRLIMMVAAILVGAATLLPLWQIDLLAPQYPEGLGLTIWASHLGGSIEQINLLNHYIGMKFIVPSSIPELEILPVVILVLMGLGLGVAAIGKRSVLVSWIAVTLCASVVGLYDFYRWEYDYGHDLNANAPIKVEGMAYQPPLLGHKQLLNIDVYSYPSWGGMLIITGIILALLLFFSPQLKKWKSHFGSRSIAQRLRLLLVLGILGGSGLHCTTKPQSFQTGIDHCDSCLMTISDSHYGGEIITKKGKLYKFDSLSCLGTFYSQNVPQVQSVYVSDFVQGRLILVEHARFLVSPKIHSPMGRGVIAASDLESIQTLQKSFPGEVFNWADLLKSLQSS